MLPIKKSFRRFKERRAGDSMIKDTQNYIDYLVGRGQGGNADGFTDGHQGVMAERYITAGDNYFKGGDLRNSENAYHKADAALFTYKKTTEASLYGAPDKINRQESYIAKRLGKIQALKKGRHNGWNLLDKVRDGVETGGRVLRDFSLFAVSGFSLIGGAFLFSSNVTGNAISNLSNTTSSWIGGVLILIGVVALGFWIANRKK